MLLYQFNVDKGETNIFNYGSQQTNQTAGRITCLKRIFISSLHMSQQRRQLESYFHLHISHITAQTSVLLTLTSSINTVLLVRRCATLCFHKLILTLARLKAE